MDAQLQLSIITNNLVKERKNGRDIIQFDWATYSNKVMSHALTKISRYD